MNDSVPAMLDAFHLHKLPSHGRCSGICLDLAKGFCLDSTKMALSTTVIFYFSTFKSNIKIYLKYHINFFFKKNAV